MPPRLCLLVLNTSIAKCEASMLCNPMNALLNQGCLDQCPMFSRVGRLTESAFNPVSGLLLCLHIYGELHSRGIVDCKGSDTTWKFKMGHPNQYDKLVTKSHCYGSTTEWFTFRTQTSCFSTQIPQHALFKLLLLAIFLMRYIFNLFNYADTFPKYQRWLTLKVLVTTIDALGHFETG